MQTLTFTSRQSWRTWLRHHHNRETEAWLVLYKKHLKRKWLSYEEAVEEALCFGWIDGQLRRIDDSKHQLRFSPRRRDSVWAPSNIRRVNKLIRQGRITEAGLSKYKAANLKRRTTPTVRTTRKKHARIVLPVDLAVALRANAPASRHFRNYPPSFRLLAIHWIRSAKTTTTRQRRIRNVVHNAAKHERPTF